MSTLRRYEILVPLVFNDGTLVPRNCWHKLLPSNAPSLALPLGKTQIVRGFWEHEGTVYKDNFTRFFVDVPDLPEHRRFFTEFKERLKDRFDQLDVWITSHPMDVI
jgi:hypothetical protein